VVKCFTDRWWAGWKRRGWKNSQGKPVANRDLWEQLIEVALDETKTITFTWVKGHSGDRWNDVVDELATEAARTQRATSSPG
jgi:ribonuclease HI